MLRVRRAKRNNDRSDTATAVAGLGLDRAESHQRFIPAVYKTATVEARRRLIQGLFDTDGSVARPELVEFTTTSPAMSLDVADVCRSLGGIVTSRSRVTRFTHNGEKKAGRRSWRLMCRFPCGWVPVSSVKHLAKWGGADAPSFGRMIDRIVPAGDIDCRCITVANEDGLYVTSGFLVTHNSALATNFVLNTIVNVPSLFFSMEMSRNELAARVIAIRSQVPLYAIMGNRRLRADSDDDEIGRVVNLSNVPTAGTLWIDDTSHLTTAELTARVRRSVQKYGVRVVVVDYLQRMQHDVKAGDSTSRRVGETAKAMKTMARVCDVPVICLAQLNRQNVNRADTKPVLSDLRDSGEIEQEADVVMMLHPEERPADGQRPKCESISILIEKQRNGPTGEVKLDYVRPFTEFRNQMPGM